VGSCIPEAVALTQRSLLLVDLAAPRSTIY